MDSRYLQNSNGRTIGEELMLIPVRGVFADIDTGLVYGQKGRPIGSKDPSGYLQIDGGCTESGRAVAAHIVIWEAAYGPVPDGREMNHINGIKTDNRLVNLEAITHRENILHAYRIGLKSNVGEKHPSHKLTESDVREIRQLHRAGYSKAELATRFHVVRRTINDVILLNTWKHVQEQETT